MKRRWVIVIGLIVIVVVLVAGAASLVSGVIPMSGGHKSARPPCEQLPDRLAVADAIASHGDLVARITGVGPGVTVEAAMPCDDQPDRAIVRITYGTENEWEGVNSILGQEGFGVAVEVVSD